MLEFQIATPLFHIPVIETIARAVLSRSAERGRYRAVSAAPAAGVLPGLLTMPSLFRFLVFLGLLGGLAYGTVFSLANFVKLHPREIVVTVPPSKFFKQPLSGLRSASSRRKQNVTIDRPCCRAWTRYEQRQGDGASAERLRRWPDRVVSRHAGGRARRRREYACGLSQRSRRSVRASARAQSADRATPTPTTCAAFSRASTSAASSRRRWRGGCRRCASSIVFSMPRENAATIRPRCWKDRSAGAACRRC